MNRLSWDTTAPRRPSRRKREPAPHAHALAADADLLRPAWDELRRMHRF